MEKKPSSVFRIDERVFITMALTCIVALLMLAYRYKNYEPCHAVRISTNTLNFIEQSLISFKAETTGGETYYWDFGDNTKPVYTGTSATHAFKYPGSYTVTVTVNGKCTAWQNVFIKESPIVINTELKPVFTGPDTAIIFKPVKFKDMTQGAYSWEWRFGESNSVDATTRESSWIFTTPGPKIITLRINGRPDMVGIGTIYVLDPELNNTAGDRPFRQRNSNRPPEILRPEIHDVPVSPPLKNEEAEKVEIKPDRPKGPNTTRDQLEQYLYEVSEGKKHANDFSESLCGNVNMPVIYRGKQMTFKEMCMLIEEVRKRRIKRWIIHMTLDNGCITALKVDFIKTII